MTKWWVALPWWKHTIVPYSPYQLNGRERHSHASINFLSCSSTAFPSHCLVEVFWESCTFYGFHGPCFIVRVFRKAVCCLEQWRIYASANSPWRGTPRLWGPTKLFPMTTHFKICKTAQRHNFTIYFQTSETMLTSRLLSVAYGNNTILFATQYKNDTSAFHRSSAMPGGPASLRAFCRWNFEHQVRKCCRKGLILRNMAGRERDAGRLPVWKWLQASQPKIWEANTFDLRRATVFCSGQCLSKNKVTRYARNLGGIAPWLRLWLQEKNEKERTVLTWCSIFPSQKARNNARQPDTAELRWKAILSVLDATFGCYQQLPTNRVCLLKLYMLFKSAWTVSREFYLEKGVYIGLSSCLAEGIATILCCAKLVFMLFTISYRISQRGLL